MPSKKRDDRLGDRLGLLEEDQMTGVGNVRHVDAPPKSFTKGMTMLGRGNAIFQTLHDEKWDMFGGLHPVILRRCAVCCSLGRGRGGPAFHLTKDFSCPCRIGDELFGRLKAVGLGRVLTEPGLERPDDLRLGDDESDPGEQNDATDKIRTIHGQASCHTIAEAVADHVRWP